MRNRQNGALWFACYLSLFAPTCLGAALFDEVASFPALDIAISRDENMLAVIQGREVCTSPIAMNAKGYFDKRCFGFAPDKPQQVSWSADGASLSVTVNDPQSHDDSLWVINTITGERTRIWPTENTIEGPGGFTTGDHQWFSDELLMMDFPCGTGCGHFVLFSARAREEVSTCSLDLEGSMRRVGDSMRLLGMGHAGVLASVELRDAGGKKELVCRHVVDGCFPHPNEYWFRYEDTIAENRILLSKHHCDAGAIYDWGATSGILADSAPNPQQPIAVGSPASVSNDGDLIASIIVNKGTAGIAITRVSGLIKIMELPLEAYNVLPEIGDSDARYLAPLWSPDDEHVLVPKRSISSRIFELKADVVSIKEKRIIGTIGELRRIKQFTWLRNGLLLAEKYKEAKLLRPRF